MEIDLIYLKYILRKGQLEMGELLFEFKAVHKALGGIEIDVAVYDNKIN